MATQSDAPRVAILGLGEAGSALAADLVAQGVPVLGWDPALPVLPAVPLAGSPEEAAREAEIVISVNSAKVALEVARTLAPVLQPGQIFADFNTASARIKEQLHQVVTPRGALFCDVALMAPVPGRGLRTPVLASGPGAQAFAARFQPLGMPVTVVDDRPGSAAARKLLRSVFMKGMAAALIEGLAAAEQLGCADWYRKEVASVFQEADTALVERLITGSRKHAVRRVQEMMAAAQLLMEQDVPPRVALATADILRDLAGEREASRR